MLELATPSRTLTSRARKIQRTLMEETSAYQRYQSLQEEYTGQAKRVKRLEVALMPALLLIGFVSMMFGHSAMKPSWYTWSEPWMFIAIIVVFAAISGVVFIFRQRAIKTANRTVREMKKTEQNIRETVASKIRYDLKTHHNMIATVDMDDGNVTVHQDAVDYSAILWYKDQNSVPTVRLVEPEQGDDEQDDLADMDDQSA